LGFVQGCQEVVLPDWNVTVWHLFRAGVIENEINEMVNKISNHKKLLQILSG